MAEIDIDKLLEKKEQSEKKDFIKSNIPLIAGGVIALVAVVVTVAAVMNAVAGKSSAPFFPVKMGVENLYNIKGKSPEKWGFIQKTAVIDGEECRILNRVNQSNYLSNQEYYFQAEEGFVRAGFSSNFGKVKKSRFVMLPMKYKKGKPFEAASFQGKTVKGNIEAEEELSTSAGTFETLKVKYDGKPYIDKTIWYAKDIGIVKIFDRIKKEEVNIVSLAQ